MKLALACLLVVGCAIEYRVPADDAGIETLDDDDECEHLCDDEREVCVAGACECRSGFEACDGVCVDLETDAAHCGECSRDCGGDPCGGGECQPAGCDAFPDQCGDSCTDVLSDPLHCRECDRSCDGDEICSDGDCDRVD